MVDLTINKFAFFLYMGVTFVAVISIFIYARYALEDSIRAWDMETIPYPILSFGTVIVFLYYLLTYGRAEHIIAVIFISYLLCVIAISSVFLAKLIKFKKSKHRRIFNNPDQNNDAQNEFYDNYENIVGTTDDALPDYYAILNISENATSQDIRKNYLDLVKKTHPDRPGGSHDAMVHLVKAYEILSDPSKRAMYDEVRRITEK